MLNISLTCSEQVKVCHLTAESFALVSTNKELCQMFRVLHGQASPCSEVGILFSLSVYNYNKKKQYKYK